MKCEYLNTSGDNMGIKICMFSKYVTRSRKRGHFAQEFIIELLVLKGRVALKQ